MTGDPVRRAIAVLCAAALTASLATVAIASEADAAKKKVKCDGKATTKVGTARADVIRGTAKRDIIAGLGGDDIILGLGGGDVICGGAGNDKLVGGAGHDKLLGQAGRDRLFGGGGVDRLFGGLHNDFLAGQAGPDVLGGGAGSDRLDGGIGVDLCSQGTGHGPMVRCELPKAPEVVPPAPAPDPDPGPTLHDLAGILAVAYSESGALDGWSTDDTLIAMLVDTNGDMLPSKGDTIVLRQYPLDPDATAFGKFRDTNHVVDTVSSKTTSVARVVDTDGADWRWVAASHGWEDWAGFTSGPTKWVYTTDLLGAGETDKVHAATGAPGDPDTFVAGAEGNGDGDDTFLEIELNY